MINLARMRELFQRALKRSRGSPIQKLLLAISGVSIGISLAYIWRKRRQKRAVGHEVAWPTLDEILHEIETNVAHREVTDAINKTKIWGTFGDRAVIEDIMLARRVKQYAQQMGLDVVVVGSDEDYDDEDEDDF